METIDESTGEGILNLYYIGSHDEAYSWYDFDFWKCDRSYFLHSPISKQLALILDIFWKHEEPEW